MNAAEHFDWAVNRARTEYLDAGDASGAAASLTSDLSKHEGTRNILTPALLAILHYEVIVDGVQGARRFIDRLPRPHHDE